MSDFIGRERDATLGTVEALQNTRRACWRSACQHDGIAPDALFVVFSAENPFVPYLATIDRQLTEARAALSNFGYGGLTLDGGKAKLVSFAKTREKRRPKPVAEDAQAALGLDVAAG